MMRALTTATILTLFSMFACAEDAPGNSVNLAEVYGKAALVGMQISVQKLVATGKFPDNVGACINELPSSTFNPIFDTVIKQSLSDEEIAAATTFFSSAAGQKYQQNAIAQLRRSMGADSKEPTPEFSATEYTELAKFSHTSGGDKLIMKRILEGVAARQEVGTRVQELVHACSENVAKR